MVIWGTRAGGGRGPAGPGGLRRARSLVGGGRSTAALREREVVGPGIEKTNKLGFYVTSLFAYLIMATGK